MTEHASEGAAVSASQSCIEPDCGASFHLDERIYVCPRCGGLLEIVRPPENVGEAKALRAVWEARLSSRDARDQSGVWRFRELLPFTDDAPVVSLREGNTPLYDAPRAAGYCGLGALQLKHQGANPTGSFKDTGMTTAVTQAVRLGARTVACASTGNTAASLAAYAARARLQCAILVPRGQVSHAKLAQSLDYGAHVFELDGNFDDAMRVVRELAADESTYLVNSINPFRLEGQKTVAAELLEQCGWRAPDHLIMPGGNLGNSSAFGKGFKELLELGLTDRLPRITVVQAEGAAPLATLFDERRAGQSAPEQILAGELTPVEQPQTLATAIKIGAPVSWKKALRAVLASGGRVLSVSEQEIADAKAIIGRDGVGCEPASATTVAGIRRLVTEGFIGTGERVVAVLTGHLLKDTDYVINYHRGTLFLDGDRGEDQSRPETREARRITGAYANAPRRVQASGAAILEHIKRAEEGSVGET